MSRYLIAAALLFCFPALSHALKVVGNGEFFIKFNALGGCTVQRLPEGIMIDTMEADQSLVAAGFETEEEAQTKIADFPECRK